MPSASLFRRGLLAAGRLPPAPGPAAGDEPSRPARLIAGTWHRLAAPPADPATARRSAGAGAHPATLPAADHLALLRAGNIRVDSD